MKPMNALDVMGTIPRLSTTEILTDPKGLAHGAFSLLCAAEFLEDVIGEEFKQLTISLRETALGFSSYRTKEF